MSVAKMLASLESIVRVYVADLAEVGDLYTEQAEDGPVVRGPDSEPVVVCTTDRGARYIHAHRFSNDDAGVRAAFCLCERVEAAGKINLDYWASHYPEYGSEAYEEEVNMAQYIARECGAESLEGHYLGPLV